jgi:hypothetical protein
MKHLQDITHPRSSDLEAILSTEKFQQGLQQFFATKDILMHDLYEACKRSDLMMEYGEAVIQRFIIREFLTLEDNIRKNLEGPQLAAYLAEQVKKKAEKGEL